jgi:hypothetical protein
MPLTMSEKRSVTNVMKEEYRKASKRQKGQMLDELCKLTGYNRSYASRKLRQAKQTRSDKKVREVLQRRKGRKKTYGPECLGPLIKVWAVLDTACGKRVAAGMDDVLDAMIRSGEIMLDVEVEAKLRRMSASTIDRLLVCEKKKMCLKGRATTKPGSLLKSKIPIRTGTEWNEGMPGFVEMDTVAHCGDTVRGQYVVSLDVTDIETTWSEQRACFNKAEKHVFAEVKEIRARIPFKVKGMDSDSGSEFINNEMYRYCKKEGILFTRGRPYKKNDGCHVEQKNWSIIRQTIGYGRFETQAECDILNEIYDRLRLLTNIIMPSQKLIFKGRDGGRIIRRLDTPLTPYRRVLASEHIDEATKRRLTVLFNTLNPAKLRREIVELVAKLYALANKLRG